jgi:hypothetical protein
MESNKCQGCIELNAGRGGENQMEHMLPGGCLYEEEDWIEDVQIKENKPAPQKVHCLVCHEDLANVNSTEEDNELKRITSSFICVACESSEDKQRELRYQSFTISNY